MSVARFDVVVGTNNMFQWKLLGPDGQPVLVSKTYGNKDDAFAAIRAIKENAPFNERYERQGQDGGKFSFRLKSASHELLATSGPYEKVEDRDQAILVVKGANQVVVADKTTIV